MTGLNNLKSKAKREMLLVAVVIILCVVWTVMNPQFLSVTNITNILRQASYTAIAAVGIP